MLVVTTSIYGEKETPALNRLGIASGQMTQHTQTRNAWAYLSYMMGRTEIT
jgi:hypothetical protein